MKRDSYLNDSGQDLKRTAYKFNGVVIVLPACRDGIRARIPIPCRIGCGERDVEICELALRLYPICTLIEFGHRTAVEELLRQNAHDNRGRKHCKQSLRFPKGIVCIGRDKGSSRRILAYIAEGLSFSDRHGKFTARIVDVNIICRDRLFAAVISELRFVPMNIDRSRLNDQLCGTRPVGRNIVLACRMQCDGDLIFARIAQLERRCAVLSVKGIFCRHPDPVKPDGERSGQCDHVVGAIEHVRFACKRKSRKVVFRLRNRIFERLGINLSIIIRTCHIGTDIIRACVCIRLEMMIRRKFASLGGIDVYDLRIVNRLPSDRQNRADRRLCRIVIDPSCKRRNADNKSVRRLRLPDLPGDLRISCPFRKRIPAIVGGICKPECDDIIPCMLRRVDVLLRQRYHSVIGCVERFERLLCLRLHRLLRTVIEETVKHGNFHNLSCHGEAVKHCRHCVVASHVFGTLCQRERYRIVPCQRRDNASAVARRAVKCRTAVGPDKERIERRFTRIAVRQSTDRNNACGRDRLTVCSAAFVDVHGHLSARNRIDAVREGKRIVMSTFALCSSADSICTRIDFFAQSFNVERVDERSVIGKDNIFPCTQCGRSNVLVPVRGLRVIDGHFNGKPIDKQRLRSIRKTIVRIRAYGSRLIALFTIIHECAVRNVHCKRLTTLVHIEEVGRDLLYLAVIGVMRLFPDNRYFTRRNADLNRDCLGGLVVSALGRERRSARHRSVRNIGHFAAVCDLEPDPVQTVGKRGDLGRMRFSVIDIAVYAFRLRPVRKIEHQSRQIVVGTLYREGDRFRCD